MTRVLLRMAFAVITLSAAVEAAAGGFDALSIKVEHLADTPGFLYVGEPVRLLVTTTNEGDDTLKGNFTAIPFTSSALYYARTKANSPVRLDEPFDPTGWMKTMFLVRQPIALPSQESTKAFAQFLLNPRTKSPWLPGAGEYELWVVLRPVARQPEVEIRSETIKVVLNDPPDRFRDALETYAAQGLNELVSDPISWLREDHIRALTAEKFVAGFGHTPYGQHVRAALQDGLRSRIAHGKASLLEKQIYERSREAEPVDAAEIPPELE